MYSPILFKLLTISVSLGPPAGLTLSENRALVSLSEATVLVTPLGTAV